MSEPSPRDRPDSFGGRDRSRKVALGKRPPSPPPLRLVIAEDEPPARRRLRDLLNTDPRLQILAECVDGAEAVQAIEDGNPDLVLLDIEMPELDGFGVIERIGIDKMPTVVFVTAYDHHAVRAFDLHALDYVLKPFDEQRLFRAITRAWDQREALAERLHRLLEPSEGPPDSRRLVIRSAGSVHRLRPEDVEWVRARGNYAEIHAGDLVLLTRETLVRLQQRLGPGFLRIHRSLLVQIHRVVEVKALDGSNYQVRLQSGVEFVSSRTYRKQVQALRR